MEKIIKQNQYGSFCIDISKEVIVDGEIGWHIRFELKREIAKGGSIKIVFPAYTHQRSIEYVQNIDYWKPHYIYAYFEEETQLSTRIEKIPTEFSHILRWKDSERIAIIRAEETWKVGEVLHIQYGGIDRMWLQGQVCPTRAPHHANFSKGNFLNYTFEIDSEGNGKYHKLDVIPDVKVIPDQPFHLIINVPTIIRPNQSYPIEYTVRDRFHNPIWKFSSKFSFIIRNLETEEEIPVIDGQFVVSKEGFYEVDVLDSKLMVEKAVFCCSQAGQEIFWGDTHCHTVLTPNIRDNNNGALPEDAYQYAREVSKLDFVSLVEQTFIFDDNEAQNITPQLWKKMGKISDSHYEPGRFVTFPGFELHSQRGDTVVLLAEDMDSFKYPAEVMDIYDVWKLYQGKKYITIPHFHRYCGGRPSKDQQEQQHSGFDLKNWEANDEGETLCEFYSAQWGRFEYPNNPMLLKAMSNIKDNNVVSFLNRGKIWGITAGSDDHDSMPGHGGLTAVYANGLNREDIFQGLKSRATYATTHTRVYLNYHLNQGFMGEILSQKKLSFTEENEILLNAELVSPVAIRSVSLILNGEVYQKINVHKKIWQAKDWILPKNIFTKDNYLYLRIKLEDENIVVSSPIWII